MAALAHLGNGAGMTNGIGEVFGLVFCRRAAIAKIDDVTAWYPTKHLSKCPYLIRGGLKRR